MWGRHERGEDNCVVAVASSLVVFCVKMELKRGVGANCWEKDGWLEAC